jgi:hypothetical protein
MKKPVGELRGGSDEIVAKLKGEGISDSDQLLEAGKKPSGRKSLAGICGCDTRTILELVNRADLARIKGVGGAYSDLLEKAGVDTVKELRTRRPDNLHAKIIEVNSEHKYTTQPPTAAAVEDWVAQAKELPPMVEY